MTGPQPVRMPWYRPRNVALAIIVGVVVWLGWVAYEIWCVAFGVPNPTHNYYADLVELSLKAQGVDSEGAGENGWPYVEEALAIMDDVHEEFMQRYSTLRDEWDTEGVDYARVFDSPLPLPDIEREREALQELRERGVFDLMERGLTCTYVLRPFPDQGMIMSSLLMPELSQMRSYTKARVATMRLAALEHDHETVSAAFRDTLRVAEFSSHETVLVALLVGFSIEDLVLNELQNTLINYRFEPDTYPQLLRAIDDHHPAPMSVALETEQLCFHDMVQHSFTDDGAGRGYLIPHAWDELTNGITSNKIPSADNPISFAALSRFRYADRRETLARADELFATLINGSKLPPSDRKSLSSVDAEIAAISAEGPLSSYMLIGLLFPGLEKAVDISDKARMKLMTTRLMIAIEWYRGVNGRPPVSLGEIVPEFLDELPVDPLNGKSFGYKLISGDPHGRPYLLYSFGWDGIDNGGLFLQGDSQIALRHGSGDGFDLVINQPREDP